ncbi:MULTISPECIES: hypothetical protein [Catenuloplanes]|uniref:Uncharacterized protein n=1 Tax=Catenuloplanes niger TaxID=587534 RepID=A0AAE3ZNY6_9ACTN|nr:hypothetical protein [Catenuloplanes niger]MDR7322382.1 hypothetical protein [Catenuloplanes niger]
MRRISKVVAGFAIAGAATFGGLSIAGPASAGSGTLVDVTVQDVLTGNEVTVLQNVAVPVAATLCGLDANVLSNVLNNTDVTECKALSIAGQKVGYVKKH